MAAAAGALGITPGAVSQQIKSLEARLGLILIERRGRRTKLTPAGVRLYAAMSDGFAKIEAALHEIGSSDRTVTLRVSTVSSFATAWLIPRIGRFTEKHRSIDVRIETSAKLADFHRGGVDVALRHGEGPYPGLTSIKFLDPRLIPVASPLLLNGGVKIRSLREVLQYPLLHDGALAEWPNWFRSEGIEDPRMHRGPAFEDDLMLLRAAAAGQGVALIRDIYLDEGTAGGPLTQVLDQCPTSPRAYYLVAAYPAMPHVEAFKNWILEEAQAVRPHSLEL